MSPDPTIRSGTSERNFSSVKINNLVGVVTSQGTPHVFPRLPNTFITSDNSSVRKNYSQASCYAFEWATVSQLLDLMRGRGLAQLTSSSWPAVLDISKIRLITLVKIQHKKHPPVISSLPSHTARIWSTQTTVPKLSSPLSPLTDPYQLLPSISPSLWQQIKQTIGGERISI